MRRAQPGAEANQDGRPTMHDRPSVGVVLTLVERSLDRARVVAVFRTEGVRLLLSGSRSMDETALAVAASAWARERQRLVKGESVYIRVLEAPAARYRVGPPPTHALLIPIRGAAESRVMGLLYVDGDFLSNWGPEQLAEVDRWKPLLTRLVVAGGRAKSPTARAEAQRQELQTSLDRHGWRPTAVSEDLRISAAAVYARCRRFGVTREMVECAQLQRLIAEFGCDLGRIGTAVGIGPRALRRRMVAHGLLERRPRGRQRAMSAEELRACLERHEWSLTDTARSLGITPAALWNRKWRLGLASARRVRQ
jgi:hypothetical protein